MLPKSNISHRSELAKSILPMSTKKIPMSTKKKRIGNEEVKVQNCMIYVDGVLITINRESWTNEICSISVANEIIIFIIERS